MSHLTAGRSLRGKALGRLCARALARRARSLNAALAVAIIVMTACGCQTTQERSAELQRAAKHELLASQGVVVTKENPGVKVISSAIVHSSAGTAVVVRLRNTSAHTLENAPIGLTVRDAKGSVLYRNDAPGLEPSLTRVSLLESGREAIWVDDQVQSSAAPTSVRALVGEATATSTVPKTSVVGAHLSTEAGGEATESGSVTNRSSVTQQNLVVYVVARRAGRVVAAGRAVLPEAAAGMTVPFQVYFVGNPNGAQIETSAPATTF